MRHLHLHAAIAMALTILPTGCKKTDPLYCDSHEDCADNPGRPYCDLVGDLPGSEGLSHTCVGDPFGDAGVLDAGSDGDAAVCTTCADVGASCGSIQDGCGNWVTCGDPCTFALRQTLEDPEPIEFVYFGDAVAVTGDSIFVGASAEDTELRTESVELFERGGNGQWQFVSKVETGGRSGLKRTIAAYGDEVAVGRAEFERVVLHHRDQGTWNQSTTVTLPEAVPNFGHSVVLHRDILVVDSSVGAHILERDQLGWQRTKSIDVSIDRISATHDAVVVADSGTNNVFAYHRGEQGGWAEPITISGSSGFGADVAASGDLLAIGANYDDEFGPDAGAVFLYRRSGSTWLEEAKLLPGAGFDGTQFGSIVDVDDSLLFVSSQTGVHVFQVVDGNWDETQYLDVGTFVTETDYDSGVLVIGAAYLQDTGAAFVYELVD